MRAAATVRPLGSTVVSLRFAGRPAPPPEPAPPPPGPASTVTVPTPTRVCPWSFAVNVTGYAPGAAPAGIPTATTAVTSEFGLRVGSGDGVAATVAPGSVVDA